MHPSENPPFPRGETFFGTSDTTDSSSGAQLEGREYFFRDSDPRAVGAGDRTNRIVRCRIVRNMAAVTLFAKYCATFQATAGKFGQRIDGLVDVNGEECYPIDEYLTSAGVRVNDLFYVVVEGPALVRTSLAGNSENVINVGDRLCGLTAATSGATTAGRVKTQDLTGATAILANQVQGRIGYALSAATTANTNSDVLCDVGHW